jgi:hypothetical protein
MQDIPCQSAAERAEATGCTYQRGQVDCQHVVVVGDGNGFLELLVLRSEKVKIRKHK